MKYINEMLWFVSWPMLMYVSYRLSLWAVSFWERKNPGQLKEM